MAGLHRSQCRLSYMNRKMLAIGVKSKPLETREQGGWGKPSVKRGQTLVEFALIVPAVLGLLFSIMWLSLAVYAYNYVSYGAREGSRYAAVHGSDSKQPVTTADAVATFVQSETAGLDTSKLTVSTTWAPAAAPGTPGGTVQVQVKYQFLLSVPFMSPVTLPLSSTSKMTIS
jgi:Flp pilus assembly protein TadG